MDKSLWKKHIVVQSRVYKDRQHSLKKEYELWVGKITNEHHLTERSNLFVRDYNAFSILEKASKDGTGEHFKKVVLTTVEAYRHLLVSIHRQDLWIKYFPGWDKILDQSTVTN